MSQAHEQLEAQRKANEAYHLTLPSVDEMPSLFDPSGFVPYPCDHGTPVKPKRYPPTKGKLARLDLSGDELPPFGGRSWGRSKYLLHMDPVVIEGKHIQFKPKCVVCLGQPKPDDFYTPADR